MLKTVKKHSSTEFTIKTVLRIKNILNFFVRAKTRSATKGNVRVRNDRVHCLRERIVAHTAAFYIHQKKKKNKLRRDHNQATVERNFELMKRIHDTAPIRDSHPEIIYICIHIYIIREIIRFYRRPFLSRILREPFDNGPPSCRKNIFRGIGLKPTE